MLILLWVSSLSHVGSNSQQNFFHLEIRLCHSRLVLSKDLLPYRFSSWRYTEIDIHPIQAKHLQVEDPKSQDFSLVDGVCEDPIIFQFLLQIVDISFQTGIQTGNGDKGVTGIYFGGI